MCMYNSFNLGWGGDYTEVVTQDNFLHASLPYRHVIQVPLYALQIVHMRNRTLTLVNYQGMVEVNSERDEYYENGDDYYGAGGGGSEGVVPEFHPAKDSYFN